MSGRLAYTTAIHCATPFSDFRRITFELKCPRSLYQFSVLVLGCFSVLSGDEARSRGRASEAPASLQLRVNLPLMPASPLMSWQTPPEADNSTNYAVVVGCNLAASFRFCAVRHSNS